MEGGDLVAKLSSKGLVGIALVLSLITAVLVYNFLKGSVQKPTATELGTVITAKADIPPKTKITAEMVQEKQMPGQYIQPGAMRNLAKVVGVTTREAIVGGEQVLERRLLTAGKQAGFTGVIPAGKRALTVSVSDVTGVAGLLKAGDYVDLIVTFDQQVVGGHVSQLLMQNLLVLAVNRESEVPPEREPKKESTKDPGVVKLATVTVAVSPEEATRVTLGEEKGKLRFALRPFLPETGITVPQPVTPTDIVGVHRSPVQPGREQAFAPSAGAASAPKATTAQSKGIPGVMVIRGTKIE